MKSTIIKRIMAFLILIFCTVAISACSTQSQKLSNTKEELSLKAEIKANKKKWNNKVKNVPIINYPKFDSSSESIEDDHLNFSLQLIKGLKDSNLNESTFFNKNTVINATVINFEEMKGKVIGPTTEVTILVNKVLSGGKSLEGRRIKTEFGGGLTKVKYVYSDFEGNYHGNDHGYSDPNTQVFAATQAFPMPKIGDKIVTQVVNFSTISKGQRENYKTMYKLMSKNFYPIRDPYVLFWIKKGDKYQPNNPGFAHIQNDEINKITNRINTIMSKK